MVTGFAGYDDVTIFIAGMFVLADRSARRKSEPADFLESHLSGGLMARRQSYRAGAWPRLRFRGSIQLSRLFVHRTLRLVG